LIKLLLTFLLITTIYASDNQKASDIFNLLVKEITKKVSPNVYLFKGNSSVKQYPGSLNIVTMCDKADLIILSTTQDIPKKCLEKILFGTRYSHLKNPNVVGAFFWQKGRPNILFYEERLKKNSIKLNPSFDKYIEN